MNDDELHTLDADALFDEEARRIDEYLSTLPDEEWERPSRCEGWSVRDVAAHLLADETYFKACLDGTVKDLMATFKEKGLEDLGEINDSGIAEQADKSNQQIVAEWRERNAETRRGFRERGDGKVDTSVGEYPARWQCFHLATELAVHADDMYVPVTDDERVARTSWRAVFSRFALKESKPDVDVTVTADGRTRVTKGGDSFEVDDDVLIEGVASRLDASSGVDEKIRDTLSATP